jgi:hypothetical protein
MLHNRVLSRTQNDKSMDRTRKRGTCHSIGEQHASLVQTLSQGGVTSLVQGSFGPLKLWSQHLSVKTLQDTISLEQQQMLF